MSNSIESKYCDLDKNIKKGSLFDSLLKSEYTPNIKKGLILSLTYVALAYTIPLNLANSYIGYSINKDIDKSYHTQEQQVDLLIKNVKKSEKDNFFGIADKVSTKLQNIFINIDKQSNVKFDESLKEIIGIEGLTGLEKKAQLITEEKDKFLKENNIELLSLSHYRVEERTNVELNPILHQIKMIKQYNEEIKQMKNNLDLNKTIGDLK